MPDPQVTVRISAELKELKAGVAATVDELKKLTAEVKAAQRPANETAEKLKQIGNKEAATGLRDMAQRFREIADGAKAAYAPLERMQKQLAAGFDPQSWREATEVIRGMASEFGKGPFSIAQLTASSQTLQRFGQFSADQLRQLADAAAHTGKPIEELAEAFGRFQKYGDERSAKGLARALGFDQATVKDAAALSAALEKFAGAAQRTQDEGDRAAGALNELKAEIGEQVDAWEDAMAAGLLPYLERLREMPDATKAAIGVGATMTSHLAQLGAGALEAAAHLRLMGVTMASLRGGLAGLSGVLTTFPGIIAAVVAAGGLLAMQIQEMNQKAVERGKQIQQESAELTKLTSGLRKYRDELKGATTDQEKFNAARRAGMSAPDAEAGQKYSEANAKKSYEQASLLSEIGMSYKQAGYTKATVPQDLATELFGGRTQIPIKELEDQVALLRQQADMHKQNKLALDPVVEANKKVATNAQQAADAAERLQEYLNLSGQVHDAEQLAKALQEVRQAARGNEGKLAAANLPSDRAGLLDTVRSGKDKGGNELTDEQAAAIRAQLQLYQTEEQLAKKQETESKRVLEEKLRQRELAFEREKEFQGKSLESERKFYQEQLELAGDNVEKQIEFKRKLNAIDDQMREKRIKNTKQAMDAEKLAIDQVLTEAREQTGVTASQMAAQLERALARLDAFYAANKKRIDADPELKHSFETSRQGYRDQLKNERKRIPGERVERIDEAVGEQMATAKTDEQKLAIVQAGIKALNAERKKGTDVQEKLNSLVKQEADLTERIRQQRAQHNAEMNQLKQQELRSKGGDALDYLKSGQTGTQKNADGSLITSQSDAMQQLRKSMDERLQLRIDAINQEMNEEIRATGNIEAAREKAAAKLKALFREEVEERRRTLKEIEGAEQQRGGAVKADFTTGQIYGSLEEAMAESTFGQSAFSRKRESPFKKKGLDLGQGRLVGRDISEALKVDPKAAEAGGVDKEAPALHLILETKEGKQEFDMKPGEKKRVNPNHRPGSV